MDLLIRLGLTESAIGGVSSNQTARVANSAHRGYSDRLPMHVDLRSGPHLQLDRDGRAVPSTGATEGAESLAYTRPLDTEPMVRETGEWPVASAASTVVTRSPVTDSSCPPRPSPT